MKRVCPTCKTHKFKKVSDGLVCKYGHKMLDIQVEKQEEDYAAFGGRTRKKIKVLHHDAHATNPRKQKSDFLLLFQYTLQVLTRCMVQELGFPPEIEPVVREFWLLYLADSKHEIVDAYVFEANDKAIKDRSSNGHKLDILQKMEKEHEDLDTLESYLSTDSSDDDEQQEQQRRRGREVRQRRVIWPKLRFQHTLVFIYLGCVYLNYPILPNDLIRWCATGQIPYLNMQQKIPPNILDSLSLFVLNPMTRAPTIAGLQQRIPEFVKGLAVNCNVVFPDLNIPLYLDRLCCQFFLPVEGYYYANFIFESQRQSRFVNTSPHQKRTSTNVMTLLMACVIAAVKLIYGVDDAESDRCSASQFDTSTAKETWFNQISNNLSRWKALEDDRKDLKYMIQHLQKTSVATKARAHQRDKHSILLNILDREPSRINHSKPLVQADVFLDANDLVIEPAGHQIKKPLLTLGEFYYYRKFGFAPDNYVKLISLASTILGEPTDSIEYAVKFIDGHILDHNMSKAIRPEKYKDHFRIK